MRVSIELNDLLTLCNEFSLSYQIHDIGNEIGKGHRSNIAISLCEHGKDALVSCSPFIFEVVDNTDEERL